jgi:hypothetical protein
LISFEPDVDCDAKMSLAVSITSLANLTVKVGDSVGLFGGVSRGPGVEGTVGAGLFGFVALATCGIVAGQI